MMKRQSLTFTGPRQVTICEESLLAPGPGEVLVKTIFSAVSPGTELLIYCGQAPTTLPADKTISALEGDLSYPLKYGYAAVGKVIALGTGVESGWQDAIIFAFQPHQSHFITLPDQLFRLPEGISQEEALFLPNMEAAVNFVMDGQPIIGERAAVFGQGIVGLLTTALLSRFPIAELITLDLFPLRRRASLDVGANRSLDPEPPIVVEQVHAHRGVDLAYELSGKPDALNQAIAVTGFDGRIVVGSWYGTKRSILDLGSIFHRRRIRLISSQVSTIAPQFNGRWSETRRFVVAWEMIREVRPSRFITHRFPIEQATEAYHLLDKSPGEAIQVVFEYDND